MSNRLIRAGSRGLAAAASVAVVAASLVGAPVAAQDAPFPKRGNIEITVLFPAGSSADVTARLLAQGMSKQLGAEYKTRVPHVEVRNKIRQRAPGSEPQNGDRVPFLVVKGPGLLCDKAEDPSWIHEHNIPLDYKYYFEHQLQKPVCDLLEPLVGSKTFETIFKSVDYLTSHSILKFLVPRHSLPVLDDGRVP